MNYSLRNLYFVLLLLVMNQIMYSQWNECITFGEAAFTETVEVVGGTGSTTMTLMYDLFTGPDANGDFSAGADLTNDVQIDIEIHVDSEGITAAGSPCRDANDLDDWELVVTLGGGQINLNSDTPNNQAVCECSDVWATVTVSFINGLMVDAQNLGINYTSSNGASLMYEVLQVTTNSIPYNTTDISNYCGTDYHNSLSMGDYLAGNAAGTTVYTGTPSFVTQFGDAAGGQVQTGWWAVDDFNAPLESGWDPATGMFTDCTDPPANEDNGSAGGNGAVQDNQGIVGAVSGADCGSGNANVGNGTLGHMPNDIITSVTYMYAVSSIGLDCNGDGVVGDNSSPSMNIQDLCIGFCPPPPPCTIANTVITPACSGTDATLSIEFDVTDDAGTGATVQYDVVAATACTANGISVGDVLGSFMALDMGTGLTGMISITGPTMACPVDVTLQQNGNTACAETITTNILECICSITGDIDFMQECGVLTISIINMTDAGLTGMIDIDLLDDGSSIATATVAPGIGTHLFTTTYPNDGSLYTVTLTDSGDASCAHTLGPVGSPPDNSPNVPSFVPNGSTTTPFRTAPVKEKN